MVGNVYKRDLQSRTKDSMVSFPGKNSSGNSTSAVRPGHPLLELQRKYGNRYVQCVVAAISRKGEVSSEIESAINAKRGGGQPLDRGIRMGMESSFGFNFSGVRVHTDTESDNLSRSLNAVAFTTGRDIFFRQGAYNPSTSNGKELLAHELTHVVQQSHGVSPKLAMGQPDDEYEREANKVARAVVQNEQIRRQPEEKEEEDELVQPRMAENPGNLKPGLDVLAEGQEVSEGPYLDRLSSKISFKRIQRANGGRARPTNLIQILTGWNPGPNRYGFQLKFRCRSTSGRVQDIQNQAPNLIWRERVTYSRNDFAHRITPPSPTILPPGGVSFSAANTTRRGTNLLEFDNVTDTHWMPTTAVRAADFKPIGARNLPAVMESRQVYQYSSDGGANWRYLAGAFIIRRTLYRSGRGLRFRTNKVRIHSVTENYKP